MRFVSRCLRPSRDFAAIGTGTADHHRRVTVSSTTPQARGPHRNGLAVSGFAVPYPNPAGHPEQQHSRPGPASPRKASGFRQSPEPGTGGEPVKSPSVRDGAFPITRQDAPRIGDKPLRNVAPPGGRSWSGLALRNVAPLDLGFRGLRLGGPPKRRPPLTGVVSRDARSFVVTGSRPLLRGFAPAWGGLGSISWWGSSFKWVRSPADLLGRRRIRQPEAIDDDRDCLNARMSGLC
jgi:hypothetical protein